MDDSSRPLNTYRGCVMRRIGSGVRWLRQWRRITIRLLRWRIGLWRPTASAAIRRAGQTSGWTSHCCRSLLLGRLWWKRLLQMLGWLLGLGGLQRGLLQMLRWKRDAWVYTARRCRIALEEFEIKQWVRVFNEWKLKKLIQNNNILFVSSTGLKSL